MAKPAATETLPDIEIVFCGQREGTKGACGQWVMESQIDADNYSLFKATTAGVIGGVYSVKGRVEGERIVQMLGKPMFTGRTIDNDTVVQKWELSDAAFKSKRKRANHEKKLRGDKRIMQEIKHLRALRKSMPWHERHEFTAAVIAVLNAGE